MISTYYRTRARKISGVITRREEGMLALTLRIVLTLPLLLSIILYAFNPRWMDWSAMTLPLWTRWVGAGLAIACVPLLWWVFSSIGSNISETVLTKRDHQLVMKGPYRWVRHPLYSVGLLEILALSLLAANWFMLLLCMVGIVVFRLVVIPKEEANLVAAFDGEYQRYQTEAGPLVPRFRVWGRDQMNKIKLNTLLLLLALLGNAMGQQAENWTPLVEVKKGSMKAVSYRARLVGDVLVIEVTHEAGWHTYALDNEERAEKRAGEKPLGIEKETRIEISGGLAVAGKWRQTQPKDLSQPDINWYTWGFEGVSIFAVKVKKHDDKDAVITINAQACKADLCAIVDDLEIKLPLKTSVNNDPKFDFTRLVEEGDLSGLKE